MIAGLYMDNNPGYHESIWHYYGKYYQTAAFYWSQKQLSSCQLQYNRELW